MWYVFEISNVAPTFLGFSFCSGCGGGDLVADSGSFLTAAASFPDPGVRWRLLTFDPSLLSSSCK